MIITITGFPYTFIDDENCDIKCFEDANRCDIYSFKDKDGNIVRVTKSENGKFYFEVIQNLGGVSYIYKMLQKIK